MKRTIKFVTLSPTSKRVTVRLLGDALPDDGRTPVANGRRALQILHLRQISDTPDLHVCDSEPFQTMRTWWDSDHWVTEMVAVLEGLTPTPV